MLIAPIVGREWQEIEQLPAHRKYAGSAGRARIDLVFKRGEISQLKFDFLIRLFQPNGDTGGQAKLLR